MNELAHKILAGKPLNDVEKLAAVLAFTGSQQLPLVLAAFRHQQP